MRLTDISYGRDLGLLVLRVGIGSAYAFVHAPRKMFGGPEMWEKVGGAMKHVGIDVFPVVWGFSASLAEFGGGLLLIIGLMVRPAAAFMAFTMAVAATMHLSTGDGLLGAIHAIQLGIVCLALVLMGAGRYSVDSKL